MNTYPTLTSPARKFRRAVKVALASKDWSVSLLAQRIGRHRNSTSRAINRGEFPGVQAAIKEQLGL